MPVLIGSDGLEYEDLTQRLLGEPRRSTRNRSVEAYRKAGCSEAAVQAWYQAYDSWIGEEGCPYVEGVTIAPESYRLRSDAHLFAVIEANDAALPHGGVWGSANVRDLRAAAVKSAAKLFADRIDQCTFDALRGAGPSNGLPTVRCTDLFGTAGSGRTGLAGAVQAPSDPLHAAPEPKV